MMIKAENIEMTFDADTALESTALRGVDLSIAAGEFVTVIGSNGSGKSTLLNILAGDIVPTGGRVLLGDEDVTFMPAHRRAARVARVFQDPLTGTCEHLTVEENMSLAASRGRSRGLRLAVSQRSRELFAERLRSLGLNLENRLGEEVGQLSGGQRQAVSLVMATLSESGVLLLDEHTAALDPRMASFVLSLTRRIGEQYNLAILMVTHSMKSALACGSRTVMLHRGQVVLDIGGEERESLEVSDLLHLFAQKSDTEADESQMLLE